MNIVCYCLLHRWTNNEGLVGIQKYNLFSTATIVCSRNTVRESSHISFFCGGDPFCEVKRQPENTHRVLTGLLKLPAGLCIQFKITDLILSFQVPCENMNIYFVHLFFCLWLVIGTYIHWFFFFYGKLFILYANGNICHSIRRQ